VEVNNSLCTPRTGTSTGSNALTTYRRFTETLEILVWAYIKFPLFRSPRSKLLLSPRTSSRSLSLESVPGTPISTLARVQVDLPLSRLYCIRLSILLQSFTGTVVLCTRESTSLYSDYHYLSTWYLCTEGTERSVMKRTLSVVFRWA
jgi:hypothetical protein